jgi:cell division protein FtsQ
LIDSLLSRNPIRRRSRMPGSRSGAAGAPGRPAQLGRRLRRLRIRLGPPRPRTVVAVLAVAALLGGGWLWFRTSPLVAIQRVQITGVHGPDAVAIRQALTSSALGMTTLDVQLSQLQTAVEPYPVVKSLHVSTQFPHGMRIHVRELVPVAEIVSDGRRVEVAADGTLLPAGSGDSALPSIQVQLPPGGATVSGTTLADVKLLAAAPYQLLPKLTAAGYDSLHGLGVQVVNGPKIYFGTADQLDAKWAAALAVLAAPSSAGADYVDVSDPTSPVAGAGGDVASKPASTEPAGTQPSSAQPTGG